MRTSPRRRARLRTLATMIGLLGAIGLFVLPATASATPAVATTGQHGSDAAVRGAQLSPNTPSVDIYLAALPNGHPQLVNADLGYGTLGAYARMAPGSYAVSVRAHGAAATSPAALGWQFSAQPGRAYTVAIVGLHRHLHGTVLTDDLNAPRAGHGRIRVIQAASRAGRTLVFSVRGVGLTTSTAFTGVSGYASVPAGTWLVRAASIRHRDLRASVRLAVGAGSVTSLLVLDAPHHGITLVPVLDAAGAPAVPNGAVPAGGGGTASRPVDTTGWSLVGVGAILVILGGATLLQRRKPSWP
jgi:hypothetical protein